jgi:signal peptidase II
MSVVILSGIATGSSLRYLLIAFFVLFLDQWSKRWVVNHMDLMEQIPVIDGLFYITSHRNRGAAFGILQNQQWLFISITIVVVIFLFLYIWKLRKTEPFTTFTLSLILGGALGNFIDRVRTGEVVDFFHFQYQDYQFPIFNVADSAIVIGVAMLLFVTFRTSSFEGKEKISKAEDS